MTRTVRVRPLTPEAFAPFGEVIDTDSSRSYPINQGRCQRHHNLARLEFRPPDGQAAISLFDSAPVSLPYDLDMMERHPLGSQAFLPMTEHPFLVAVAPDVDGKPGEPQAFLTRPGQGVNYRAGTWHAVLMPLARPGLFAVIDRVGEGENLEEHWFETPWQILAEDNTEVR